MSFSIDVTSDLVDGGGIYYSIRRGMSSGDDGGSISVSANWELDFQSDCPLEMSMGFDIDVSGETGVPRLDKLLSHVGLGWGIPACQEQLNAQAFIPSFSFEKTLLEVPEPSDSYGASMEMGIGMGLSGTIVEFK